MVLRTGLACQALYNTIRQSCNTNTDFTQGLLLQREVLFSLTFHSHPLHYSSTAAYTGHQTNETEKKFLFFRLFFVWISSVLSPLYSQLHPPQRKGRKSGVERKARTTPSLTSAKLKVLIQPQAQFASLGRSSFLASRLVEQLATGLPGKLFSPVSESNASPSSECNLQHVPTSTPHRRE